VPPQPRLHKNVTQLIASIACLLMHAHTYPHIHTHTILHVYMPQYFKGICLRNQWHLPPQPEIFATSTNGICLRNQRYLPPQPIWHLRTKSRVIAHALKGICLHDQRHSPSQLKAFAFTTVFAKTYHTLTP